MIVCIAVNAAWNVVNFRLGLIQALLAQGHQVHVLAPAGPEFSILEQLGCMVYPLNIDCKGSNPINDIRLMLQLHAYYTRVCPDVVLHYTIKPVIYGSLAAHHLGIPVLNTVTGLGTAFLSSGWLQSVVKKLYRLALKPTSSVIFQNPDDKQLFLDNNLVSETQALLVPGSGIDIERFSPVPLPDQQGDRPVFLLLGRMLRDKGIAEFVEAAQWLKTQGLQARFVLLGFLGVENLSAVTREQMEAWVATGIVEYWGETSDVRPMIARADCVVLPSYREGMPRTLLEASAMGRPLVATDVPGCREVVQDGVNGALCRVKDGPSLAQAMLRIAQLSPAQRLALGLAGRERVERLFAERYVINCYLKAISGMLK
ncbi:hypothetical protein BXU06_12120 [Aquaspirillum sp. LM1]|uniref:glycosyltransferase family 4 protein n=1 Tax=Aquaspirillum sp. LM1 TaxID=1938604 RepID=UPI000983C7F6|nr:glycosyltransferase family 4 protein [Aquaspirillum sp. LM1]AQR65713.1 hypothetical protein BXU06_12120 [Aquaspirillum sp. LM1]